MRVIISTLLLISVGLASGLYVQKFEPARGFATPNQERGQSPLIVGGSEAIAHSHPHQISLQQKTTDGWAHRCGGSIVTADKIVTAAHCVLDQKPADLRVVAGEHDLFNVDESTEQISEIGALLPHPRYVDSTMDFDYAVIRLATPLTLNDKVKVIRLASNGTEASGNCVNTGWGNIWGDGNVFNPAQLQEVTIPIVARSNCQNFYDGVIEITNRMICAGAKEQGPCNGDSGGPLVCEDGDGKYLAGIVSFGVLPCAQAQFPGVFANVSPARNWIDIQ